MPSRDRAMRELRAELDRYRAHHERFDGNVPVGAVA